MTRHPHPDPTLIYNEMMKSTAAMLAAEARFDELRRMYRTHPRYQHLDPTDQDTRHTADARTKQAIAQCAFHRDRANTLANVYQAWTAEQRYKNGDHTDQTC